MISGTAVFAPVPNARKAITEARRCPTFVDCRKEVIAGTHVSGFKWSLPTVEMALF